MVLFVNLSPHPPPPPPTAAPSTTQEVPLRHPPNRSHPLSALLATYPFLSSLARSLDHNDLYNLSSACWQFHANLSEYRRTLLSLSLRCSNDKPSTDLDSEFDWRRLRGGRRCARDLVRGCLRCGTPVCRVCHSPPCFNMVTNSGPRTASTSHTSPRSTRGIVASAKPAVSHPRYSHIHKSAAHVWMAAGCVLYAHPS